MPPFRTIAAPAVLALALLAPAPGTCAQAPPAARPVIRAARLEGALRIDGRLDEPAWAAAEPETAFTQTDPHEGQPVSERTEVRVLLGDDALYVGARLFDREAGRIRARLARRDDDVQTDEFDVYLDSFHDHLTAKRFRVSPGGAVLDGTIATDGSEDDSWDAVWEAATTVDSLGWTAEIRIPLSQLRYATPGDGTWGIQLVRTIIRTGETAEFAFTPKAENGGVSRYGTLAGLDGLGRSRHLELLPYASLRNERLAVAPGDPFRTGNDVFGAAGADAKLGVTHSLTLDLTANPDFGQVEVDPAQVNLTAFETFYTERRPFFVEGADLFSFGRSRAMNNFSVPTIFHSRRIGRAPQFTPGGPDVLYMHEPAQTTIAGAAKLTGRTDGGWAIGALDAVTTREVADYADTNGVHRTAAAEPLSHYFVGRVRRELRRGDTEIGGLVTAVDRRLDDPTLASLLRSDAYVGGLDLAHAWANRRWALDADVTGSRVQGGAQAIDATQRLSDRYLQRPDHGDYFTYDPTRTRLQGYGIDGSLAKVSGRHWLGSVAYVSRSPGYETNDIGYMTRADYRGLSSIVLYNQTTPGRLFRNWTVMPYANEMWNFGGDRIYDSYAIDANGNLVNYWYVDSRLSWNRRVMDDRLTRGGPQGVAPALGSLQGTVTSDWRRPFTASLTWVHTWSESGGHGESPSLALSLRPSPTLRVRFEPSYDFSHATAHYVTTVTDPAAASTYGHRYVFADLDEHTLALDTRLDWTMTPRLSLQLYVQPLIVSGRFTRFKELLAPETYDFAVYGETRGTIASGAGGAWVVDPGNGATFTVPDPDFNFRSLLGNAVLRWEYRPGSTFYLVWQQQRTDVAPIGDFDVQRDYRALLDHAPQNVFAAKVTYWIGL